MRNAESRFAMNPTNIDIQRSSFTRPHSVKTSFNVGDIVPFYLDQDVLPGDTFQIDTSKVVRMQTLLTPMMDNLYLDTYYFFVPNRLVWKHWKEFMGENTQSAWLPSVEYTIPQLESPASTGFAVGTIADYLGVPTGVPDLSMSALPFRAYALICNEWFRDENLTDPLVIPDDETTVTGVNTDNYVTDVAKGGAPFVASKYHDYFTSALPAPQKGPSVEVPVTQLGDLPVVPLGKEHSADYAIFWRSPTNNTPGGTPGFQYPAGFEIEFPAGATPYLNVDQLPHDDPTASIWYNNPQPQPAAGAQDRAYPSNLWAQTPSTGVTTTINELRTAFQIQKFYERLARGGSRYIEMIKSFFNVTSPDARLQRPEYLGGNRIPININQVVQNSATDAVSPQGNTAAFSLTTDRHSDFTRSFTEHGMILGLMVARYDHTYQQGLERGWSRKTRFDYYFPVFAHLGEQAILNKEIYAQADTVIGTTGEPENEEVFGYQEAWAEYRYKPSHVTGEMRSTYSQSLDVWHLGDDYSALPALSDAWIREDKANVDRVLAVTSSVSNQLFADIFIQDKVTRPMPMYSVPGLIDHF